MPEPSSVHPVTVWNPFIIGFAPEPYEEIMIGLEIVPDFDGVIVPSYTLSFMNKTESPADRMLNMELSLAIVFQGVAGFWACVLVRESSPIEEEK